MNQSFTNDFRLLFIHKDNREINLISFTSAKARRHLSTNSENRNVQLSEMLQVHLQVSLHQQQRQIISGDMLASLDVRGKELRIYRLRFLRFYTML